MIDAATAMVRTALAALLVVGLPAVVVAAWLRGARAGWTAFGAMVLVMGGFALNGLALRWAARRSPAIVQAVMLGGLLTRLVLYGLLAAALAPTDIVDGPTLAVVVPVALVVLLALEVRVARRPEFRMIDPAPWVPEAKDHS